MDVRMGIPSQMSHHKKRFVPPKGTLKMTHPSFSDDKMHHQDVSCSALFFQAMLVWGDRNATDNVYCSLRKLGKNSTAPWEVGTPCVDGRVPNCLLGGVGGGVGGE